MRTPSNKNDLMQVCRVYKHYYTSMNLPKNIFHLAGYDVHLFIYLHVEDQYLLVWQTSCVQEEVHNAPRTC